MDDASFQVKAGMEGLVPALLLDMERELAALGLEINMSKCALYVHDPASTPQATLDAFQALGVPVKTGAVKVLGSVVVHGQDEGDRGAKAILDKIIHPTIRFLELLKGLGLGFFACYTLLRASGIPRINHLMRTTNPILLTEALSTLDGEVERFIRDMFEFNCPAPLDDAAFGQARLILSIPTRLGGGSSSTRPRVHTWLASSSPSTASGNTPRRGPPSPPWPRPSTRPHGGSSAT